MKEASSASDCGKGKAEIADAQIPSLLSLALSLFPPLRFRSLGVLLSFSIVFSFRFWRADIESRNSRRSSERKSCLYSRQSVRNIVLKAAGDHGDEHEADEADVGGEGEGEGAGEEAKDEEDKDEDEVAEAELEAAAAALTQTFR